MRIRKLFQSIGQVLTQKKYMGWLAFIIYAAIFLISYAMLGPAESLLAVLPVMLIGWGSGLWAGVISGLLSLPLNILLFNLAGAHGLDILFRNVSLPETILFIIVGAAFGRMHDLAEKLRQQVILNQNTLEDLRKSQANYQSIFDKSPIGMYRTTPEGQILDANPALVKYLGYSELKDLLLVNVRKIFAVSDDRKQWEEDIEEQGIVTSYEEQLLKADGSLMWVEDNGRTIRDDKGNILYYEGSLTDISKRKNAEKKLRESEADYRNLLNNIPHKIFLKDRDGTYIAVNPAYARDFNLSAEDIVGKADYEINPPDLAEKYHSDDERIIKSGIQEEFDEDYFHMGQRSTVHTIKIPVRDESGEITNILGIFWDITDRKRMEETLRESEQNYEGLFEHSPVSLWVEDFSKVKIYIDKLREQGTVDIFEYFESHQDALEECLAMINVIDINQATLGMYHAQSKEEILANISRIFADDINHTLISKELSTIIEGRKEFEGEGQNRTITGEIVDIYIRWSVAPGFEDSLSKVFTSIVDITSRNHAENLVLQQKAQAEALTQLSSALSAATLEKEKIFHIIVERTANLVGDTCVLALLTEDRESLEIADYYNCDTGKIPLMGSLLLKNYKIVGKGILSRAMETQNPVFIAEFLEKDFTEVKDPGFRAFFEQYIGCSLLVFPLIAQGQVSGVLVAARDHPGKSYTLEDQAFLQNVANQAALTLVNLRLHNLVKQQSRSDPLTGLFNSRYFFDLSEIEFSRSKRNKSPISMLMFDLDHFKEINDTYGHIAGDQVLRTLAGRCMSTIRGADLVGRIGGDEFSILLPETDSVGAYTMAERIRKCITESPVINNGVEIWLTVSLGVATKTKSTAELLELYKMADVAMYKAKISGRNRVA